MQDKLAGKFVLSKRVLCSALLAEAASRRAVRLHRISAQQAGTTSPRNLIRVRVLSSQEQPRSDTASNPAQ